MPGRLPHVVDLATPNELELSAASYEAALARATALESKVRVMPLEERSNSKEAAKEFLASEGVNTEKLLSEGLRRIKQMQMMANANKTEKEMQVAEKVKAQATQWVDDLLGS